mmetsp:Transcript_20813/g.18434  ORF Transcript_20813/g.18434 Transcript_20813/m.18434 type:complete len:99 (+) Transcript_20813:234-530(+)
MKNQYLELCCNLICLLPPLNHSKPKGSEIQMIVNILQDLSTESLKQTPSWLMIKISELITEISEIQGKTESTKENDWLSLLLDFEYIRAELLKAKENI